MEIGAPFHMVLSKGITFIFGWKSFVSRQTFRIPSFHFRCRFLRFGVAPKKCIKIYDSFRFLFDFVIQKKQLLRKWSFFPPLPENTLEDERLEPTAITHKKKGKWSFHQSSTGIMFQPLITGWLIGILIMVYHNPYITGWYNPLYNPTNQGFFFILQGCRSNLNIPHQHTAPHRCRRANGCDVRGRSPTCGAAP